MASLFRGGWTEATLKTALASFGLTLLFLVAVFPSTAQVSEMDKSNGKSSGPSNPNIPKSSGTLTLEARFV